MDLCPRVWEHLTRFQFNPLVTVPEWCEHVTSSLSDVLMLVLFTGQRPWTSSLHASSGDQWTRPWRQDMAAVGGRTNKSGRPWQGLNKFLAVLAMYQISQKRTQTVPGCLCKQWTPQILPYDPTMMAVGDWAKNWTCRVIRPLESVSHDWCAVMKIVRHHLPFR